jgi:sugar phosphate isomerase/epimerase
MKIGVFTVLFGRKPFEEMLDYVVSLGLGAVEIGTGGYPGNTYANPASLLASERRLKAFCEAIAQRGLEISALSCHGNPLHPDSAVAKSHHRVFEQTVELAAKLGVGTVVTFSGCPGADATARMPNWIVSPWPPEFSKALEWQWTERVVPYWKRAAALCRKAGVRVAIEMHPNFVVYNAETMNRLRLIAPAIIGCNFDPSHLFWQGADPVAAIRAIGDGILHVHAQDCKLDQANISVNGVLDTKPYTREADRSWIFRTVGWGNDAATWKAMVSALRLAGYDRVLSIEHEDSLMSGTEGLRKAVAFLRDVVIADPAGTAYWA